jgi:hypothetical protein
VLQLPAGQQLTYGTFAVTGNLGAIGTQEPRTGDVAVFTFTVTE